MPHSRPNGPTEEADGEEAMTTNRHNLLRWLVTSILLALAGSGTCQQL